MVVLETLGEGLWMAFQMAWEVEWALVLGFLLSGVVQAWIRGRAWNRRSAAGTSRRRRAHAHAHAHH